MLEAALRGDLDGGLEQEFQDDLGAFGEADQKSLSAYSEAQDLGLGEEALPPEQIHSEATPATPDADRQGSGGGQGVGKPQDSDAGLGGGAQPWEGQASQILGSVEGEPQEAQELEGDHLNDSNSDEYRSPRERSSSLNLQELLQGHGDLFSEEELLS